MSALPVYYSVRDFKDGYRGYWLDEQPESRAGTAGFFWNGRGHEHATQYPSRQCAREAAEHFENRGAFPPESWFVEVHAPSVAEVVAELHREGFVTAVENFTATFAKWPVHGRLMENPETRETCLVFKEGFLRAAGYFLPYGVPAEEIQQDFF